MLAAFGGTILDRFSGCRSSWNDFSPEVATFKTIKARLFQFLETPTEKQLRISTEWERLYKTKQMTAYQFEAEWERIMALLACLSVENHFDIVAIANDPVRASPRGAGNSRVCRPSLLRCGAVPHPPPGVQGRATGAPALGDWERKRESRFLF